MKTDKYIQIFLTGSVAIMIVFSIFLIYQDIRAKNSWLKYQDKSSLTTKELTINNVHLNSLNAQYTKIVSKREEIHVNHKILLYGTIENSKFKYYVVLKENENNISQELIQDLKVPENVIEQYFPLVLENKTTFCLKSILTMDKKL